MIFISIIKSIYKYLIKPINRLFSKAVQVFLSLVYLGLVKVYYLILPKRIKQEGLKKISAYLVICSMVLTSGLLYLTNPNLSALFEPNNFVTGTQIVTEGLEVYKYETESTENYDTVTDFNTFSYSSGQFEAGEDDIRIFTDSPSELLSLNHYGDNAPDVTNNGDWWDDDSDTSTKYNWRYRQCFDVDYTSGTSNLSEYQIYLDFDTQTEIAAGRMQSGGEDIRIVDINGNEIDHYIADDINTISTRIWIQPELITAGATTNYCLYYGNSAASSTSNKDSVFSYSTPSDIYYVLAENADSSIIDFGSYVDANSIDVDSYNQNFDKYEINETSGGGSIGSSSSLRAKGPIQATIDGSQTDSTVPASNAGTAFTYRASRADHDYHFTSPFCDANIEIYNTNNLTTPVTGGSFTVNTGSSYVWSETIEDSNAFANNDAVYITSTNNCPVLAFHATSVGNDTYPMYPSSSEDWYGVGSNSVEVSSFTTTNIDIYDSGASSTTSYTLDSGNDYQINDGGAGPQGANPSQRIVVTSGGPIGVKSQADGDGNESSTLIPRSEMDTKYIIPEAADYVTLATIAGVNTTVEVYNSASDCIFGNTSPTPNQTATANSNNDYPGHILFGAIPQGGCLVSNHPIAPYFEKTTGGEETNLWSWKQGRQRVRNDPSVAIGAVETGTWNLGTANTWNSRLPVTITNNVATSIEEYPVRIPLTGQTDILTNAQADGGDIRIGGSAGDGTSLQDYYVEEFGNTFAGDGDIWTQVDIASSGNATIYIYYNAATIQTTNANQEAVFTYTDAKPLYYVVDDIPTAATINIYSLIDDNELFFGGASYSDLDLGENYTDPGVINNAVGTVVQGEAAAVTGPLNGGFTTNATDALSPVAWSGTKFLSVDTRDEDEYSLLAPFSDSTVTFERHDGTGWVAFGANVNLTQGVPQNIVRDVNNQTAGTPANSVRITSTTPIIIHKHANRTGAAFTDSLLLYPVEDAFEESTSEYILYGINSNELYLAAENATTNLTIYYDDGTDSGNIVVDSTNQNFYTEGAGITQGQGRGMKIVADGPIHAMSQADSDGNEGVTFLPKKEFGNEFLFTTGIQYVSIVSNDPGTVCEIFDDTDTSVTSVTLGTNSPTYVNQAELGAFVGGNPSQYFAGYYMTCDDPVYAYYEKNVDDTDANVTDETTILTHAQARKRAEIEPIVTDVDDLAVLEEGLYYESGFDMDTTATEPEAFLEFIFDSTNSDVAWDSIELVEGVFDNAAVSQNNVDRYKVETAAATNSNCAVAVYPAYTEATVPDPLGSIEIPETNSDNNCIKVRITMRTGDPVHSPIIDQISLNYYNPVLLDDILSSPTITIDGSDTDSRRRILKYTTGNINLTGSQSFLRYMDSSNNTVFSNFDLDLYDIDSDTNSNQFDLPPFPGGETDSINTLNFDDTGDLAVYLRHDRTLGTGVATTDMVLRVDILSNTTTIIDREFQIVVNQ